MMQSYLDSLKHFLLAITGEGVLIPDLDKLFETCCRILILSDEWGVRGMDGSRCIDYTSVY